MSIFETYAGVMLVVIPIGVLFLLTVRWLESWHHAQHWKEVEKIYAKGPQGWVKVYDRSEP